jgi:predicted transcriptional regulator
MELPQEVELWYVVPSIRKALVTELKKHDLKQKDIAKLLGITESAISQYIKDKRASYCYDAFQRPPLKPEIEKAAKTILDQKDPDPAVAMREITRLCKLIKDSKIICDIHRKQNPNLKACDICYSK